MLVLLVGGALNVRAGGPDYRSLAAEIHRRLQSAGELYRKGDPDAARREVQGAYFEIFENLEGPVRINISAKDSAQMEAAFGEIRRLIGEGRPVEDVSARIHWLDAEIERVVPALESGHRLKGEASHGADGDGEILPQWQESLKVIDDSLASGVGSYQAGDAAAAKRAVQEAWYAGFKNSELEIAVRRHRSADKAAEINRRFSELLTLIDEKATLTEFGYQISSLLGVMGDQLPGLPASLPAPAAAAPPTPPSADWARVAADIRTAVHQAIDVYEKNDARKAGLAIQDAYFDHFEASGMEARVGLSDPSAKTALEGHFTRLVSLIKAGRPAAEIRAEADLLGDGLDQAAAKLGQTSKGSLALFVSSLVIILREGVEALLIVAAIIAFLIRNQQADKISLIANAVISALVASALTAGVFRWLMAGSGASRELLEGVTMLLACVLLFSMSYWLLSKAEARHWKAYLEGRLFRSISRGSMLGLWSVAFLAVYREGAETILFYFAMLGDTAGANGSMAILAGFLAGCVLLMGVYAVMRYTVVRLPLRPFFIITGLFLYGMAFVFAGKGVMELIEGGVFTPTMLKGMPEISWLGVFPYMQTLAPQLLLLVAAIFAAWVISRSRATPAVVPPE